MHKVDRLLMDSNPNFKKHEASRDSRYIWQYSRSVPSQASLLLGLLFLKAEVLPATAYVTQ